ncbi:TonB family protein [Myxococcaceae bacterium GXIMD 01537]
MLRFRTVLALLSLAALSGCATTSSDAGRKAAPLPRASAPKPAPTREPPAREPATREPPAKPAPPPAPVKAPEPPRAAPSGTAAEFVCGPDGTLVRREPEQRPAGVLPFEPTMTRPEKVSGPAPAYTPEALEQRVQGQLLARCVLSREGAVRTCRILKPLPPLEEAVLTALCASRYTPALSNGQPVDVEYTFNIRLTPP